MDEELFSEGKMMITRAGTQQTHWRWFSHGLIVLLLVAITLSYNRSSAAGGQRDSDKNRPNIIWLVLDDASPTLGCYGDPQAITPNMDRLAREGARFTRAFTHAPVCAPSRSGLITGMYPTTIGSHHMRSRLINQSA
jgi:hypothetical protein